jgi:hypothetical protein
MRYVPDRTGRFAERPHYEGAELDRIFERLVAEFLKAHRGKIEFPITTDDLTVLIERDTENLDSYADLSTYGPDVEGVTEFVPRKKPRVRIAQDLASSENRENRYRTTLTHEYGHVHLHAYLFAFGTSAGLFGAPAKADVIACKRDTMITAKQTDWMEWQGGIRLRRHPDAREPRQGCRRRLPEGRRYLWAGAGGDRTRAGDDRSPGRQFPGVARCSARSPQRAGRRTRHGLALRVRLLSSSGVLTPGLDPVKRSSYLYDNPLIRRVVCDWSVANDRASRP